MPLPSSPHWAPTSTIAGTGSHQLPPCRLDAGLEAGGGVQLPPADRRPGGEPSAGRPRVGGRWSRPSRPRRAAAAPGCRCPRLRCPTPAAARPGARGHRTGGAWPRRPRVSGPRPAGWARVPTRPGSAQPGHRRRSVLSVATAATAPPHRPPPTAGPGPALPGGATPQPGRRCAPVARPRSRGKAGCHPWPRRGCPATRWCASASSTPVVLGSTRPPPRRRRARVHLDRLQARLGEVATALLGSVVGNRAAQRVERALAFEQSRGPRGRPAGPERGAAGPPPRCRRGPRASPSSATVASSSSTSAGYHPSRLGELRPVHLPVADGAVEAVTRGPIPKLSSGGTGVGRSRRQVSASVLGQCREALPEGHHGG